MSDPRRSGLPPDAFTVVMATGIVAVAARDAGLPTVSVVLAGLAAAALVVLALGAVVARCTVGRAIGPGPGPVTGALALFSAVAACDVVAAAVGARPLGVSVALGLVAALLWVVLVTRAAVVLRSRAGSVTTGDDGPRGAWLLGAVATESLALTGARLARAGVAPRVLLTAAAVCWVLGVAAYVVTVVPIVRRLRATRAHPDVLTPDMWVLMGAAAIATVSGSTLLLAAHPTLPGLDGVLAPALLVLWAIATAWIPVLIAAEIRRARRRPPGYERARWSTVFPAGMYSAACALLVAALLGARAGGPDLLAVLHDLGRVAFWVALPLWGVVALGLVRHRWRGVRART